MIDRLRSHKALKNSYCPYLTNVLCASTATTFLSGLRLTTTRSTKVNIMCGIIAVILASPTSDAAPELHQALYYLQHRGQDACGIATCSRGGRIYQCKGNGLAARVFREGQ